MNLSSTRTGQKHKKYHQALRSGLGDSRETSTRDSPHSESDMDDCLIRELKSMVVSTRQIWLTL